jgi:hypothetical protein
VRLIQFPCCGWLDDSTADCMAERKLAGWPWSRL